MPPPTITDSTVAREWRTIDSAPKNGTGILLGWAGRMACSGMWFEHRHAWMTAHGEYVGSAAPTHWMPLPDPPKEQP